MEPFAYRNILGNIIPFLPMGFLVPVVFKSCHNAWKTMLVCTIGVCGIELVQLVAAIGFFDIDDILLNTVGCLAGYVLYRVANRLYGRALSA